jgi:hypothetical protein
MSLWRLNQSTPVISYLARSTKADEAIFASPYTPNMAQSSVRGACGFVLVGNTDISTANFRVAGNTESAGIKPS